MTRVGVLADTISAPPFVFQCKDIKATLVERAQQRMNGISNKLVDLLDITCQSLVLSYEDQFRKILLDPGADSVAWEEMKLCLEVCSKESEQFYYQNEDIKSIWKLINENSISLDDSISQVYWEAFSWPCKIVNEFERAQNRLEESRY